MKCTKSGGITDENTIRVEKVLTDIAFDEPNEETLKAIEEAKDERNLSALDLKKFKEFVASL